ncbi:MAG: PEGA domain-containing protein [Deltaproteobacteria bacterium]|nr:PEGA domain-containing protein [Deltaproteobacteria bacterium]
MSTLQQQMPSAAARAIAAQAVVNGTPANGATVRGVMPIPRDYEDDAATIRVDSWIPPEGARVQAQMQAAQMQAPTMQRPMAHSIAPGAIALAPVAHYPRGQFAVAPLTDPTVRVTPLEIELPSKQRSFAIELLTTVKRFAAPLAVLMVVAVFLGGYLAFDGQGGKARRVTAAAVPAPEDPATVASRAAAEETAVVAAPTVAVPTVASPTVTPIIEPNSVSAVIASKLAEARAAESMELAKGAVVVDEDAADEAPEIEMEAVELTKTKRTARSGKSSKSRKRLAAVSESKRASKAEKIAKAEKVEKAEKNAKAKKTKPEAEDKDKSIAEAALPANVANKTDNATGKISVTSNVPAMIYLDGRSTQMMTPKKFAVPAGKHKITLLEPTSKKAKTQDIEVAAGKTATVDKQF